MTPLTLNEKDRLRQFKFPSLGPIVFSGKAVRPLYWEQDNKGRWVPCIFLMTCVAKQKIGTDWVTYFISASHVINAISTVGKEFWADAGKTKCKCVGSWSYNHDFTMIAVKGMPRTHATVPISAEAMPFDDPLPSVASGGYAQYKGWTGLIVSQGGGNNGGETVWWKDDLGTDRHGRTSAYWDDPAIVKPIWGNTRIISMSTGPYGDPGKMLVVGPYRGHRFASGHSSNSGAPMFILNPKTKKVELLAVTHGGVRGDYKLPDGRVYTSPNFLMTYEPEGLTVIAGGSKLTTKWGVKELDRSVSDIRMNMVSVAFKELTSVIASGTLQA
jgi:hypothetical protein